MKKLIVLFIVFFYFIGLTVVVNAQDSSTVKKINYREITCYSSYPNEPEKKYKTFFAIYDRAGNEVERHEFDGDRVYVTNYRYDFNNRKTDGLLKEVGFYDEYGNFIPERNFYFKYIYDTEDDLIEESKFDTAGVEVDTKMYDYDSLNHKIRDVHYNYQDINDTNIYVYDKLGNMTQTYLLINGVKSTIIKYKYDAHKRIVEEYQDCGPEQGIHYYATKFVYVYNQNYLVAIKCYNYDGKLSSSVQYEYDYKGNMAKETHYSGADVVDYILTYEYWY